MRLPSGYGAVIKLKGNRRKPYQARITKGYNDDGKQIFMYLGYYTKKDEALTALAEYNESPYDISKDTITFEEVYKKWSVGHYNKISPSAIENYSLAFRKYCKSLYKMRFKDIRLAHLQDVIDNCGMAYPTRSMIKTLLNQLFNFGIKNDIIDKQYAKYIDVGKREGKAKRKPFTPEEIERLFQNVDKLDYVDTVLIMIFTCMRVGEMLLIETKNVHLEEGYMKGGLKTEAGKNRTIPINKKIEPYIKKYYNPNNEYLIMNTHGRKMEYSNYRREKFDNIMEKLNMKHCPHECRHTGISLLNSAGANSLCIKRIVGHSSQDITEDVYTHKTREELIHTINLI